ACASRTVAQVHPQAARDVGDVVLALAQVLVLDAREHRTELFVRAVHGPRGVDALGPDDLLSAPHEERIVEHQDLGVEDRRQLAPPRLAYAIADLPKLLP